MVLQETRGRIPITLAPVRLLERLHPPVVYPILVERRLVNPTHQISRQRFQSSDRLSLKRVTLTLCLY